MAAPIPNQKLVPSLCKKIQLYEMQQLILWISYAI